MRTRIRTPNDVSLHCFFDSLESPQHKQEHLIPCFSAKCNERQSHEKLSYYGCCKDEKHWSNSRFVKLFCTFYWYFYICPWKGSCQTGNDRVDAVALHKIIWKSGIFWEEKLWSQCPLCLNCHDNAWTKHYEVKLPHKTVFRLSAFILLIEGWGSPKYCTFHWFERKIYIKHLSLLCATLSMSTLSFTNLVVPLCSPTAKFSCGISTYIRNRIKPKCICTLLKETMLVCCSIKCIFLIRLFFFITQK